MMQNFLSILIGFFLSFLSKVLWVVPVEWVRWLLVMLGMALSGKLEATISFPSSLFFLPPGVRGKRVLKRAAWYSIALQGCHPQMKS